MCCFLTAFVYFDALRMKVDVVTFKNDDVICAGGSQHRF